jgi:hypothetical protein
MHQKSALGFNSCEGDRAAMTAAGTPHRAILAPTVFIAGASQRDHWFQTETIFLPSIPVVPTTPPPRIA